jgi:hypothetical protein
MSVNNIVIYAELKDNEVGSADSYLPCPWHVTAYRSMTFICFETNRGRLLIEHGSWFNADKEGHWCGLWRMGKKTNINGTRQSKCRVTEIQLNYNVTRVTNSESNSASCTAGTLGTWVPIPFAVCVCVFSY